jgi:IS5 family transposase
MRPGKRKAVNKGNAAEVLLDKAEKIKTGIWGKVEHLFRTINRQFGFLKVRFRGSIKNAAQLVTLFALSNLWMVRKKIIGAQG